MANSRTVFCELAFWREFSKHYSTSTPFPDNNAIEMVKSWIEIYSFFQRSNLLMDCPIEEFANRAKEDNKLAYLWKQSAGGYSSLDFCGTMALSDLTRNNPSIVICTKEDSGRECLKYGLINISPSNYNKKLPLFIDNGAAIQKGQKWDWTKELATRVPESASNSMIIVDNYIFGDKKNNLYSILSALLPQSSTEPYIISIFYLSDKHFLGDDIKREHKEAIEKIRPNLNFHFEYHGIRQGDFHDRTIATNNYWIESGAGFDLCNRDGKATKTTRLSIAYPGISDDNVKGVNEGYNNLINDALKILRRYELSSHNRLLQGITAQ